MRNLSEIRKEAKRLIAEQVCGLDISVHPMEGLRISNRVGRFTVTTKAVSRLDVDGFCATPADGFAFAAYINELAAVAVGLEKFIASGNRCQANT